MSATGLAETTNLNDSFFTTPPSRRVDRVVPSSGLVAQSGGYFQSLNWHFLRASSFWPSLFFTQDFVASRALKPHTVIASPIEAIHRAAQRKNGLLRRSHSSQWRRITPPYSRFYFGDSALFLYSGGIPVTVHLI
jgi:hypothetical protein